MKLQLNQEWQLGERIDKGGFGQVYAAKSDEVDEAVVKLVPKAPGAEREMLFVDLGDARNVVPVIDSGETEDSWALVMPRAEKSLRRYLDDVGGSLDVADAVSVLSDIATALADLDGRVVHRDLKPENVLLLDGHWRLADFGISRYAEATTAPDTQKFAMSPPYAAPERWRAIRATSATDVYSLGITAYELLSGSLPFPGPSLENYRDQHLHQDPAPLSAVPTGLAALVEESLYKAPEARPTPANILTRLARVAEAPSSDGLAKLQEANRAEAVRRGASGRQASERQSEAERRAALSDAASQSLMRIADALRDAIEQAAPLADFSVGLPIGWTVRLKKAELRLAPPTATSENPWVGWVPPAFQVVSYSTISLQVPKDRYGYEGRSHSLWFCDAQEQASYKWFETAFMISPLIPEYSSQAPYALPPGADAAKAIGPGTAEVQLAWPFTPLVIGDLDDFISRWAGWFAEAAQGQLNRPSMMPERQWQGSWRKN